MSKKGLIIGLALLVGGGAVAGYVLLGPGGAGRKALKQMKKRSKEEKAERLHQRALDVAREAREAHPETDSRARMAAMLEAIGTDRELRAHRYASEDEVERLLAKAVPPDAAPERWLKYLHRIAYARLRAGLLDEAKVDFERLVAAHAEHPDLVELPEARHGLAITELRRGEVANCQARHGPDSCLFPLAGGGIHVDRAGAEAAAKIYAQLLEADPDDLAARWLLNLCHQALGQHPDAVPERFRIAPDALESDRKVARFPNVAAAAGVDTFGLAGGVVFDDLDGDLDLDILASAFGLHQGLRVFLNRGDGTFEDATDKAGVDGLTGGLNLIQADYDNDGDVDVFVLRGAWWRARGSTPNSLLRNRGDGTFEEVTEAAGLLTQLPTQTGVWADFNNDGWLDLYVGNERIGPRWTGSPGELHLNLRDGTFRNVAEEAGLTTPGHIKGTTAIDYDNDGDMDIFVSVFRGDNRLMRNDGTGDDGIPRFTDVAREAGVLEPHISFPTWSFDYDNDGLQDIWVSGYGFGIVAEAASYLGLPHEGETPRLYRNKGDGTFEDVTKATGMALPMMTMGCNYGDIDMDGWLDMYLATGAPQFRALVPNRLLRNTGADGAPGFEDVTQSAGVGHLQKGHAVGFGDGDGDGDQDIYAVMGGAYDSDSFNNVYFQNPGGGGRGLTLLLEGKRANRSGIGARVAVAVATPSGPRTIHRVLSTGGSFGSNPARLVVGLGDATEVTSVDITWPGSGTQQRLDKLAVDTAWRVVEGEGATALP